MKREKFLLDRNIAFGMDMPDRQTFYLLDHVHDNGLHELLALGLDTAAGSFMYEPEHQEAYAFDRGWFGDAGYEAGQLHTEGWGTGFVRV